MKKFLLIALTVAGFAFAAAPTSQAGVSVGIGIGVPIGCPGYYPYPYYGYYGPYYGVGYRSYAYRPYYWNHGRRIYRARRHWR
jgi:hypothetical protein